MSEDYAPKKLSGDRVAISQKEYLRLISQREALGICSDAINEMFRYYDGGETRGSYDGRPERDQLRRAGYIARQALSDRGRG